MMSMRRWCVGVALAFATTTLFAESATFAFLEEPGPGIVGFKLADQYDVSRPFPGKRPLQTLVWYPAAKASGQAMTVGDYAALADTETDFDHPTPAQNKWRTQLKASLAESLHAHRDVPEAKGRYPVVVYAPSDSSTAWENADLCEYLASHGYVVIASPSMGATTRDMTDDVEGINAQAKDISFLITYAASLPDTDMNRLAVVSFSWGGISSLFAAARDPRIKALAAMDGSMRYFPGLVKKAGDVHPETMTLPLLFFTSAYPNWQEDVEKYAEGPPGDMVGPNVLNAWTHGDLFTVNMLGMSHGEFSAMFQRRKSPERFAEDQIADYGRDDANIGYAWTARYIERFLDASLKHDAAATAWLKRTPVENGVPRHFMAVTFRPAR